MYHAELGRFVSRDPIGYPQDCNPYCYVRNHPATNRDPSGLAEYPPGAAKCRGTPNGISYVAGRGQFKQAVMREYMERESWLGQILDRVFPRVGSNFLLKWAWKAAAFTDAKGCCCCDQIAFVQITASSSRYLRSYDPQTPPPTNWHVDKSIPYPYGETKDPCAPAITPGMAASIILRDQPNAPLYWKGGGPLLKDLWQRFWTCVYCRKGNEGPRWNVYYQPEATLTSLGGITIYGCIYWEQRITRTTTGKLTVTRKIGSASSQNDVLELDTSTNPPVPRGGPLPPGVPIEQYGVELEVDY